MQITLDINDELYVKALELSGFATPSEVCRAGLFALIERETARRLVELGGSAPGVQAVSRRRSSVKQ